MAKRKEAKIDAIEPTPEQIARDNYTFERETARGQVLKGHYRKERQLEILSKAGIFTDDQSKILSQYRDAADRYYRSPYKDSLNKDVVGDPVGDGPLLSKIDRGGRIAKYEEAAGSLVDILRAVIVNDKSPASWAIEKHGSRNHCKTVRGVEKCYPEAKEWAVKRAKDELRLAARWILADCS